jgi:hypothetical protein
MHSKLNHPNVVGFKKVGQVSGAISTASHAQGGSDRALTGLATTGHGLLNSARLSTDLVPVRHCSRSDR